MGGNTDRKLLQRHCTQALNDCERVLGHGIVLRGVFEGPHPEYLPLLDAVGQTAMILELLLGDFFEAAWGRRPAEFPRRGE